MDTKCIFISYSHDSDEHRTRVLQLSQRLRKDGLITELDQYINGSPLQGWPRWMTDKLDEADHVLVICTETYYRRFRGHEEPNKGKGVDWEGALITQELYDARNKTCKFIPVLFDSNQQGFIPEPLQSKTHYVLDSELHYQAFYDFLLGQSGVEPGEIGELKVKPKQKVEPLTFFNSNSGNTEKFSKQIMSKEFKKPVLDLAKFICRPRDSYEHVFNELNQNSVKACFFLFTSNQTDIPMDFAIGLRESMKNNFSFQLIAEMKKGLDVDACSLVVANPWDYDQKEKFIEDCLNKIYKRLNPDRNKMDKDEKDIEKLLEKIVNVLKTAPKPIVLFSKALEEPAKKGWFDFTGQKFSKKINERCSWVDQLNEALKKAVTKQDCQPLILLFCLQVDDSFLKKTKPCFYLTHVQKQDFANWYSDLVELYPELYNTLESLLRLFKPALTYQQVLKHIEATLSPGK